MSPEVESPTSWEPVTQISGQHQQCDLGQLTHHSDSMSPSENQGLEESIDEHKYLKHAGQSVPTISWSCAFSSVQSLSRVRLCDSMNCCMPGFPVHHQLPELIQTHIHWVSDAIQPSHPLLSPSSPAFDLSQHQGFFQWVSFSHEIAKVLELQHQSFQWIIQGWFPSGLAGFISLQSKGLSRVILSTTIQKHQLFSIQPSLGSNFHIHAWLLEKP